MNEILNKYPVTNSDWMYGDDFMRQYNAKFGGGGIFNHNFDIGETLCEFFIGYMCGYVDTSFLPIIPQHIRHKVAKDVCQFFVRECVKRNSLIYGGTKVEGGNKFNSDPWGREFIIFPIFPGFEKDVRTFRVGDINNYYYYSIYRDMVEKNLTYINPLPDAFMYVTSIEGKFIHCVDLLT